MSLSQRLALGLIALWDFLALVPLFSRSFRKQYFVVHERKKLSIE